MPTGIEVEQVREQTPGCEHVLHLNNAGAALVSQPVLDAVVGHLMLEARVGGYEAAELAQAAIDGTRPAPDSRLRPSAM